MYTLQGYPSGQAVPETELPSTILQSGPQVHGRELTIAPLCGAAHKPYLFIPKERWVWESGPS